MANEFIIKKGLISKADSVVSGSLVVTEGVSGSFSGSFEGDGSGLTNVTASLSPTASYALTASYVETAQTASYVLNAVSSSYALTASYAVSASHEIIKEVSSSYADTASFAQSGDGIFSGSFSGSFEGLPIQDPFPYTGDAVISGSLTVQSGSSNSITGITLINPSSPGTTQDTGAGITMFNYTGATGSIHIKDYTAGGLNPYHPAMIFNSSDAFFFQAADDARDGTWFTAQKVYQQFHMDQINNNAAEWIMGINNGGGSYSRLVIGQGSTTANGWFFQNNGYDEDLKIGETTGAGGTGTYTNRILISSSRMQIGDSSNDLKLSVSGSITSNNTASAAYFVGDGSQLTNVTASFSPTSSYALTASYVETSQTASYVLNAISSSYAETASYVETAQTASYVTTSSIDGITNYVRNDQTSSMTVLSSSFAISSSHSETTDFILGGNVFGPVADAVNAVSSSYSATASYVETAQTASYVLNAVSSSYALTASYVNPLTQDVDITGQTDITGNVLITGSLTVSGSNSIVNLQELQFDTEHIATGHTTGRMYWSDSNKTVNLDMQGSDVVLQVGQEEHVYAKNTSGVTINNGDAVRISGAAGGNVTIIKAISTLKSFKDITEQDQILGLATEQILDNQSGYVTTFGAVRDLDTSIFSEGDILYLSDATSGSYTNIKPIAPNFPARIGVVQISDATEGVILARPSEPIFLTDIAQITSSGIIPNEKTYLCYDDNTDLIQFTNKFSGSFSGSFQGKLGPISNTTYRLTSSLYTASAVDYRIGVKYTLTGSVSIQLPLISDVGEIEYKFKDEEGNAQTNNITLTPSGSNLIDGDINAILNRNNMAIGLYNDGVSNWFVE